jgi:hypothetical protein
MMPRQQRKLLQKREMYFGVVKKVGNLDLLFIFSTENRIQNILSVKVFIRLDQGSRRRNFPRDVK